jgi:outer membrane protein assembly factor BamE (lipoprotein component of BamABCDE complex)
MKHIYCVALIVLILTASAGIAQNLMENKPIKYPYYASKERIDQIKNNYKKVKKGMTPQQVKSLLGEPDETRASYEPRIWGAKQDGYTQWFIIQRKCKHGSVKEKDEKLVRVGYDLQWKVEMVTHWGFDEKEMPPSSTLSH